MQIGLVSTLMPHTHYAQYLARALEAASPGALTVYADRDPRNETLTGCGRVKALWPRAPGYRPALVRAIAADRPDAVHLQHEFTMYGGAATALLFPLLLAQLRRLGVPRVVTVHAVVRPESIDRGFLSLFGPGLRRLPPSVARRLFAWIYRRIGREADRIIVHTRLMEEGLVRGYGLPPERMAVIPHGVPEPCASRGRREPYALYFGYLARRKGLEQVLAGFARFRAAHPGSRLRLILAGGTIPGQESARHDLERQIQQEGLGDWVSLTGFIAEPERLETLFAAAGCILIPAAVSIAASGPLAQALRYGKCILASRIGNLIEELESGADGLLVEPDGWAEAFAWVDDPAHAGALDRLEAKAREKAARRAWPRVADAHWALYRSLAR